MTISEQIGRSCSFNALVLAKDGILRSVRLEVRFIDSGNPYLGDYAPNAIRVSPVAVQ